MKFRRFGDRYLIRLYQGEEVVASLAAFARENGIQAAVLSGIGAVREAVLGYFDPETRAYYKEELAESHEIAGMNGNLSL
ncbi:MAG: DNA-binding protein, partial [Acidobacteria bacterium]|nr:DNA-binding protein [Acidobacteriota bacterium]